MRNISLFLIFLICACQRHPFELFAAAPPVAAGSVEWIALSASSEKSQADANILRFDSGEVFLIDAGISGGDALVTRLLQQGIRRVDKILVSHAHADHFNGIDSLLESPLRPKQIYFNLPSQDVCDHEGCDYSVLTSLLTKYRSYGVEVLTSKQGDVYYNKDGVTLKVLYAFTGPDNPSGSKTINDTSVILQLINGTQRVLFTGDLDFPLGTYLSTLNDPELKATILKVPHHGTDSLPPDAFFDWVGPQAGVVPSPAYLWNSARSSQVRNWFADKKVPVMVTGRDGAVSTVVTATASSMSAPGIVYATH